MIAFISLYGYQIMALESIYEETENFRVMDMPNEEEGLFSVEVSTIYIGPTSKKVIPYSLTLLSLKRTKLINPYRTNSLLSPLF